MNNINLLPLAERQPKWPINNLLIIAGLLLLVLYSSIYSYNAFKILNLEKDLDSAGNQYELLQPTLEMMRSSNNKQQLIDKKNNTVVLLTKDRSACHTIIQHLVIITPQQVCFTDLSKSENGVIQIKGSAITYAIVAEFMKNIEQDSFFIEPVLSKVESDTITPLIKFEIMVKSKGIQ